MVGSLRSYYLKRGLKRPKTSELKKLTSNPYVVLLCNDERELAQVQKLFKRTQGVYCVTEKRPKEQAASSFKLYTNDFNFKGEPTVKLPVMAAENNMLINLVQNQTLAWYWYGRSYDLKVDLASVYQDAGLAVTGEYSLEEKLDTLCSYLNKLKHG